MASIVPELLFTYRLTAGNSFEFTEGLGYKKITISNEKASTTNGTLLGTGKAGQLSSAAINIEPGQPATIINAVNAYSSVTITAPAGCNLNIIASKN